MSFRMFQRACVAAVVLAAWAVPALVRAEAPPSWTCLPEETVVLVRIPSGRAVFEALRAQTRFGALLLNADRVQKILGIIREENEEEFGKMTRELAQYGLKLEDLGQLLEGELGYAAVVDLHDFHKPSGVGLAWLEPGGDLAERILKAIAKGVEEHKQDEHAVQRIDLDLAGHKIMHLAFPLVEAEEAENEPIPDNPEELRRWLEERRRRQANAPKQVVGHSHALIAQLDRRLLVAHSFGGKGDEDDDPKGEEASAAALEQTKGVFARFLEAHSSGRGRGLSALETPGLADALPGGTPVIEILADPRPFLKVPENEDTARMIRLLRLLGIDRIGPIAIRQTLDKNILRQGLFLSAPAPRNGLVSLLEQKSLAPEPPAWVPSSALSYSHFSFDLGKLYGLAREMVVGEMGDAARARFEGVELQVQALTQTDPATLLSSLGSRHSFVGFAPKVSRQAGADDEVEMANRSGVVWQVSDEEVWKRLMAVIAPFINAAVAEEQGFTGLRIQQGPIHGGLFVGQGYLVLGIGEDVLETLLSSVKNPPSGSAALRAGPIYKRGAELLPPESGLGYSLVDSNRQTKILWDTMIKSLETPARMMAQAQAQANVRVGADAEKLEVLTRVLGKIKKVLPKDEEMEGVMGVSVNQTIVTQDGLISRGLTELPAP